MIQDRLKDFREKIEVELAENSLFNQTDWLNELKKTECTAKHIRSLYLIWLHLIVDEMEKSPDYGCANTIESFMQLNCHDVSIDEIYQMVCDCFNCDGLFKSSRYKYEDAANSIVISKPAQGLRNANKSLYDRGELLGFPWYFSFHGRSLRDIAGIIKLLCERTQLQHRNKKDFLAKLKKYINSANAVVALSKGLNPKTHKVWLDDNYAASSARQYSNWLDPAKHSELVPLLNKHGIAPDIYSCTNLVQLTQLFEELVENLTTEAQQANNHPNMVSAVRCYIEHLLVINGITI